jgi:hypothetical protein
MKNVRENKFTANNYSKSVEKEHMMTFKRDELEKRNEKLLRSNQQIENPRYNSDSHNSNRTPNPADNIEEAQFPLTAKTVMQY